MHAHTYTGRSANKTTHQFFAALEQLRFAPTSALNYACPALLQHDKRVVGVVFWLYTDPPRATAGARPCTPTPLHCAAADPLSIADLELNTEVLTAWRGLPIKSKHATTCPPPRLHLCKHNVCRGVTQSNLQYDGDNLEGDDHRRSKAMHHAGTFQSWVCSVAAGHRSRKCLHCAQPGLRSRMFRGPHTFTFPGAMRKRPPRGGVSLRTSQAAQPWAAILSGSP